MTDALVGVDIGSSAVRAVKVSGIDREGFAVVTDISVVPLKQGAVDGGRIRNPQLVSLALSRVLREAGLPRHGFVLGCSTPDVAAARMVLPAAVRPNEWVRSIRAQDRQISPTVPLADSVVAANLVRTDTTGEGQQVHTLVVAAVLRREVETLRAVCKLAGLTPRAIDLSGAATMRALTRVPAEDGEVATVVDIGATQTTVVTRQGQHLRSIRILPSGGEEITRAITSVTGEDFDDADRRKHDMRIVTAALTQTVPLTSSYGLDDDAHAEPGVVTAAEESMAAAAESLVDAVAQAVENDAANFASFTSGVSLCGGTAMLRGLKERLAQRIGVPVQIGRPWALIQKGRKTAPYFVGGTEDPAVMMSLATAIGLALWKEQ